MIQPRTKIADLVLEGGGVKGNALVGAVAAFEEAGYRFNRVAGTSAGAMVAAMLAAGIPAEHLHEHLLALDYTRFRDPARVEHLHLGGVGIALAEIFGGGMYSGKGLRDAVAEELLKVGVNTFADLRLHDPDLLSGSNTRNAADRNPIRLSTAEESMCRAVEEEGEQ